MPPHDASRVIRHVHNATHACAHSAVWSERLKRISRRARSLGMMCCPNKRNRMYYLVSFTGQRDMGAGRWWGFCVSTFKVHTMDPTYKYYGYDWLLHFKFTF